LITELTIDDLQDCLDSCPRGKSTRENMKYLATQMYKYAEARLMVSKNIAAFLYCDGEEATRPAFTPAEIAKIKNAVGTEYGADYVYCLIYTGFRPNEMLNLTRFNYDPEARILTGGFKTEAGTNRPVPVSPKILPIIEHLYAKADPWLFTDQQGQKLNDATFRLNIFYPLLSKLGIQPIPDQDHPARLVPYSCRHTFANFLKTATGPDKDKAALMGHTDIGMTKKYQSADLDTPRSIIQSI
jgi:integrase